MVMRVFERVAGDRTQADAMASVSNAWQDTQSRIANVTHCCRVDADVVFKINLEQGKRAQRVILEVSSFSSSLSLQM